MRLYVSSVGYINNDSGEKIAIVDFDKSGKVEKINVELTVEEFKRDCVSGVVLRNVDATIVAQSLVLFTSLIAISNMKLEIVTSMPMEDLEYWLGVGLADKAGVKHGERIVLQHMGRTLMDAFATVGFLAVCEANSSERKIYKITPNTDDVDGGNDDTKTDTKESTSSETTGTKRVRTRKTKSSSVESV